MRKAFLPLVLMLAVASAGFSQTNTSGEWAYTTIGSNAVAIVSYSGPGGNVVIPTHLEGKPVTQLGPNGEAGASIFVQAAGETNSTVRSIVIPATVTNIAGYAFRLSVELLSVTIPDSVTTIGFSAFSRCFALTSVTIPNSVTNMGQNAFLMCSSLTNVNIGSGLKTFEFGAFRDCTGLTNLLIPNTVRNIGVRAFDGCSGLTNVTISAGVETIEENAFAGCTSLVSLSIPDSVISIGAGAFYGCSALSSVQIPRRYWTFLNQSFDPEIASEVMIKAIAGAITAAVPDNHGIATKADLGIAVSNASKQAIAQVQAAPNDYNLYSSAQYQASYDNGVTAGTSLVTAGAGSEHR